jgi:hypothetical protein
VGTQAVFIQLRSAAGQQYLVTVHVKVTNPAGRNWPKGTETVSLGPPPFIVVEEKQLVSKNRPADAAAKVSAMHLVGGSARF